MTHHSTRYINTKVLMVSVCDNKTTNINSKTYVFQQVLEPLVASLLAGIDHISDVHDTRAQTNDARVSVLDEWREPHRLKRLIH